MVSRRLFVIKSVVSFAGVLSAGTWRVAQAKPWRPTPRETKGPFYPVKAQKDTDFDLTRIEGHAEAAKGRLIEIAGQVLNTRGEPIEDAIVELWQANAAGRYHHPRDTNPAPLDPDFQGWAIVPSGRDGGFRFKTVFPGAYPASADWTRPPHIHFIIKKNGFVELATQMYFPGEALNESDLLLKQKSAEVRKLMMSTRMVAEHEVYRFNIVLKDE